MKSDYFERIENKKEKYQELTEKNKEKTRDLKKNINKMIRIKSISIDVFADSKLVNLLQDNHTVIEGGFCIYQLHDKTFIKDERDDCTDWDSYETNSIYYAMLIRLAEYIEVMGSYAYPEVLGKYQAFLEL